MNCPQCGTENRGASNFCRFCGFNIGAAATGTDSGYVPSVPPPEAAGFKGQYPPESFQTPPGLPVYNPPPRSTWGNLVCPRCGSHSVNKGGTPVWAVIVAIVLALPTCFLSLFLFLVKDSHRCLNCANAFR